MLPKRISIRTALYGVTVTAIAFAFGPSVYRRIKYFDQYQQLTHSVAEWTRRPGADEDTFT